VNDEVDGRIPSKRDSGSGGIIVITGDVSVSNHLVRVPLSCCRWLLKNRLFRVLKKIREKLKNRVWGIEYGDGGVAPFVYSHSHALNPSR